MGKEACFSRSPRFYYGPVEREIDGKSGYQLCLLDLKSGLFVWFDYPAQLGKTIAMLIEPVAGEEQDHRIFQLPVKRFTSEIVLEDFEDPLQEQEALSERRAEESAFSFCDPLMTRKDHLRNFSAVENDHLFSEHSAANHPRRKERIKKQKELVFIPKVDYQTVCELLESADVESENKFYGPFFGEADFTNDLNYVPEEIRAQYKFLDLNTLVAQAKVIEEEVRCVFHPEMQEEIKKAHGWTGMLDPGLVEVDSCLQTELNLLS